MSSTLLSGRKRTHGPVVPQALPITLNPVTYAGSLISASDGELYRSNGTVWLPVGAGVKVLGPALPQDLPIPLDPAAYIGAIAYGSDGEMYRSTGLSWKPVAADVKVIGPAQPQELPIALDATLYEGGLVYGEDKQMYRSDGTTWQPVAGQVTAMGPGIEHPVPIALDPVAYKGSWVYGSDGEMHRSNGIEWKSVVQLAEDISANVIRIITAPEFVTVGPGRDYETLGAALQHYSAYTSGLSPEDVLVTIWIAGDAVLDEQIILVGSDLSFCMVIAENSTVPVDISNFVADPTGRAAFIKCAQGSPPRIYTTFVATGTAPGGMTIVGISLATAIWDNSVGITGLAGFKGFQVGLFALSSSLALGFNNYDDNTLFGIQAVVSSLYMGNTTAKGCGTYGLLLIDNSSAVVGGSNASYRKTLGTSSSSDIVVQTGSSLSVSEDPPLLGGFNIPVNRWTASGVILKSGTPMNPTGIITPESYTVGTVPSATTYAGGTIYVTNGNSGSPCLAVAQGGTWKRIALGTTIST
jgi:hypothetical protein